MSTTAMSTPKWRASLRLGVVTRMSDSPIACRGRYRRHVHRRRRVRRSHRRKSSRQKHPRRRPTLRPASSTRSRPARFLRRRLRYLVHGTTVVINAFTQRRGVKTALVTTAGFRDALAIGRGNRPDMYNLKFHKPEPIVPRSLRFEVRERVDGRRSSAHANRRRRPRLRHRALSAASRRRGDCDLLPSQLRPSRA